MNVFRFQFTGYNDTQLPALVWMPEGELRAVLQVTHGMTEHMERYEALAQELTDYGIAVAGFDLRGHGKNAGDTQVASFGEGGWEASIEDMHLFFQAFHERLPDLPYYMLGFSLGSFLLREYLGQYPEGVRGAILVGTGYQPELVLSGMTWLVKREIQKAGFDQTTELVKQLAFGAYNRKFKPNRTDADWLCSDIHQLDDYLADPLCRKTISAGLFLQMLEAMKRTGKKDTYQKWNKQIAVLLLSGCDDPVSEFGKGVYTVREQMHKAGITRLTVQMLPNARHDVFHEEKSRAADTTRALIAKWILRNQG